MGDVCCAVIHGTVISVFYDTAVKSFGNTVQFVDISIDDQSSVLWKKLRKLVERTADIVQILEEIQMILVNIENNAYLWKEMKETVGVFAGFRNEQLLFPHLYIPSDRLEYASYGNRWIHFAGQQDMREHGCSGSLAVSA